MRRPRSSAGSSAASSGVRWLWSAIAAGPRTTAGGGRGGGAGGAGGGGRGGGSGGVGVRPPVRGRRGGGGAGWGRGRGRGGGGGAGGIRRGWAPRGGRQWEGPPSKPSCYA